MKSRKFATVIFALGGLMFLSSVGFAVYKDVKPAPVSLSYHKKRKNSLKERRFSLLPIHKILPIIMVLLTHF